MFSNQKSVKARPFSLVRFLCKMRWLFKQPLRIYESNLGVTTKVLNQIRVFTRKETTCIPFHIYPRVIQLPTCIKAPWFSNKQWMQSALECVQVSLCVDSLKMARSRDNQAVDTVGHKINSCLQQYRWFQNWQKKTSLVVILIVLLLKIDNLQLNVVVLIN